MVNQQIFLPMVPNSAPIVVNVNQNDYDDPDYAGRLIFNLVNEGQPYDMDGASAIVEGSKPDGTAFAYNANVISASVVRVNLKQQMTAVAGRVVCQLVLSNSDGVVGSYAFWLEVQGSALHGDPSQTDIPAIIAAMNDAVDRAEQAADNAEAWSEYPPYIGANGNWFTWNVNLNLYEDTGIYAQGRSGNRWYPGTAVSGKSTTPTIFPTGIVYAYVNDFYFNTDENAIYHCTVEGDQNTAKWVYDSTLTGAANRLTQLQDVGINNPQAGQVLTYDPGDQKWENKDPDKSFVRYGGALSFADLATNAATLLDSAYEDVFFLITDGGIIGSGEAALYWSTNFSDGDEIFADSHVAVINVNRGTANPPSYKYDDFGGFVDISGKADKTELSTYTAPATQTNGKVTFDNLSPNFGYGLEYNTVDANGVDAVDPAGSDHITIPKWSQVSKTAGTNANTIKLVYTIVGGTDGVTRFNLRIKK